MANNERKIVLDLETKKSFDEVGGRGNLEKLGVSLVGVYDYPSNKFLTFEENEIGKLEELFKDTHQIIGFNIKDFDFPVLQPYLSEVILSEFDTLDLMDDVEGGLGFRLSLNNIAKTSLGEEKSGHGLEAIKWYRAGDMDSLKKYCLDDVRLTKDIYEYGLENGHILLTLAEFNSSFDEENLRSEYAIPASWAREVDLNIIRNVINEAFEKNIFVEIDYVSSTAHEGEGFRKKRLIEITGLAGDTIKAYCFLRKGNRAFKIPRILGVKIK